MLLRAVYLLRVLGNLYYQGNRLWGRRLAHAWIIHLEPSMWSEDFRKFPQIRGHWQTLPLITISEPSGGFSSSLSSCPWELVLHVPRIRFCPATPKLQSDLWSKPGDGGYIAWSFEPLQFWLDLLNLKFCLF